MDEAYIFSTMGGIKFYYRISSQLVNTTTVVSFSYGSYKGSTPGHEASAFTEELKTFSTTTAGDGYVAELQSYVKHLGYKLWQNTANSASKPLTKK